jgi:hypothetical protein
VRTASTAYAEQVGSNRHRRGKSGEIINRYSLSGATAAARATPRGATTSDPSRRPGVRSHDGCELTRDLVKPELARAGLGDHDHIVQRQQPLQIATKELPNSALHVISDDRASNLATDRYTETRAVRVRLAQHDEVRCVPPSRRSTERQVLPAAAHPRRFREALAYGRGHLGCFGGIETVSRFRPLARRRFNTCRPPGDAMRARKPCVRLRRRLLG